MKTHDFQKGDIVQIKRSWTHLSSGTYVIVALKLGKDCNAPAQPDFMYPIVINDEGKEQAVHPTYLTLLSKGSSDRLIDQGAEEYEEIILAQELMNG